MSFLFFFRTNRVAHILFINNINELIISYPKLGLTKLSILKNLLLVTPTLKLSNSFRRDSFMIRLVYIPNPNGKAENLREGIWLTTKLEKPTVSKRDTKGFFKRRSRVIIPRSKIHFSIWIGYIYPINLEVLN